MGRLEGKVAVITGGNSGIGRATCKLFAEEGAQVVAAARRAELLDEAVAEIVAAGGDCIGVPCDVGVTEQVEALMAAAIEKYGRIDILVNAAGVGDFHTPALKVIDEFWDNIINVDLTGVMRCCRSALKYMTEAGKGTIVNVGSVGGVYSCAGAAYSSAKAGVMSLTKNIAIQYYGTGIRCNCVSPGGTNTGMFNKEAISKMDKEMLEATAQRPHRFNPGNLEPIQQAYVILFLASDESNGVNGENITVDYGGRL